MQIKRVWTKIGYEDETDWKFDWAIDECDNKGSVKLSGTTKLEKGDDEYSYKLMFLNLKNYRDYFCVAIFRRYKFD